MHAGHQRESRSRAAAIGDALVAAWRCCSSVALLIAGCNAPVFAQPPAATCAPAVGPLELVAGPKARAVAGAAALPPITDTYNGFAWPDTPLGVVRLSDRYLFFGSDGAFHRRALDHGRPYGNAKYGSAVRTTGTLDDPLGISTHFAASPPIDVTIAPNPNSRVNPQYGKYDYIGGGPVYRLPGTDRLLMVYHAETPTSGTQSFYSVLGLAVSPDLGRSWTDRGEIIRINQPYRPNLDGFDIGDPPLVIAPDGRFVFIYFRDWIANGTTHWGHSLTNVSVARVPLAALVATLVSPADPAPPFMKYAAGGWMQPGIGGRSSDLDPGAGTIGGEAQVAYDTALRRYLMIVDAGVLTALAESVDGLQWTQPVLLHDFRSLPDAPTTYAMPIGTGVDPHVLGRAFYVYITRYPTTGGGWGAASVERFTVTCKR